MGTRLSADHSPLIAALLQCQSWVNGWEHPKIPQGFYEASGMAPPRAEGCCPESRETLSADDDLFCPCCPLAVMMEILPRRCVPIAKKEILYMGTFGLACWLAGVIFIDRKRREESIGTLTEVLRVLIFPEGTRNHGGSMLPFKRGAFQLAVKAQVPIIPVVLSSYDNFYNQKEKKFTPGEDDLGQRMEWWCKLSPWSHDWSGQRTTCNMEMAPRKQQFLSLCPQCSGCTEKSLGSPALCLVLDTVIHGTCLVLAGSLFPRDLNFQHSLVITLIF
uniref:1-acylglycerol-3-phosphate O-acyltransferase n=1 Tax=Geospiza parvula TaxID=87175 RepID=A0A8C3ME12_GEOPR